MTAIVPILSVSQTLAERINRNSSAREEREAIANAGKKKRRNDGKKGKGRNLRQGQRNDAAGHLQTG